MLVSTLLFLPMDDLACLGPLPGYKMESVGCEEGRKTRGLDDGDHGLVVVLLDLGPCGGNVVCRAVFLHNGASYWIKNHGLEYLVHPFLLGQVELGITGNVGRVDDVGEFVRSNGTRVEILPKK